jgi:hypothetical protein
LPLRMTDRIATAYRRERSASAAAFAGGDVAAAWRHLERAHLIAQPFAAAHVGSHLAMARLGLQTRDRGEVLGQIVRVLLAGPASLTGRIPVGNVGRAATPLGHTSEPPDDIASLLATHQR